MCLYVRTYIRMNILTCLRAFMTCSAMWYIIIFKFGSGLNPHIFSTVSVCGLVACIDACLSWILCHVCVLFVFLSYVICVYQTTEVVL